MPVVGLAGAWRLCKLGYTFRRPTIGHCKELTKLCRQIRNDEVEMRVWPVKGSPRIVGIPDAAFRNNSDKSSQRAMTMHGSFQGCVQ